MDVSASPKPPTTPSMAGTPPQAPATDSLQLPLPPLDLIFSTSPNGITTQRYQRAGDLFDARKAVVGKVSQARFPHSLRGSHDSDNSLLLFCWPLTGRIRHCV